MLKLLEVDRNLWLVILKVALIDSMSEILLHCIVSYCCLLYVLLSWILVTQLLFRAQNVAPKHKRRGGGTLHFLQLLTSPPCGLISFKIGANLISLLNIMPKVFFCWNENEQFLEEAWSWLTSCATAVRRSTSHFIILGISQKWAVGE